MSAKPKPQKSRPATEHDPFDDWTPKYRELARAAYLEYTKDLAKGAEALHTLELALITACRALPAVYKMIMPAALENLAMCHAGDRGAGEVEKVLLPVFSQLPAFLAEVRAAKTYTNGVLLRQAGRLSDDPNMLAFVKKNTRLPQVLALEDKWEEEVLNATDR